MSDIKASFSGERGEHGECGERGERGKRGHTGATGPAGATGPSGPAAQVFVNPQTIGGNGSQNNPFSAIDLFPMEFTSPPVMNTIYVRTTGSDANDGLSPATALRTFQFAITKVPLFVQAGQTYRIDITGIDELLPTDYTLPAWKVPAGGIFTEPTPYQVYATPIEIFATPQPVAALPLADTIINSGDATVTSDPITKLLTITLNVPRASWTPANLVGKQIVDGAQALFDGVIATVTSNTTLQVAAGSIFGGGFTFPLNIAEPSAHLHGSASSAFFGTICVNNVDCIGFTGISITSDNGLFGLCADGNGTCLAQFCNLESPRFAQVSGTMTFTQQNRCYISHVFGVPQIAGETFIFASFFDAAKTVSNFGLPMFSTPSILTIADSIFIGCDPIEILTYLPGSPFLDGAVVPHLFFRSVLVKGGTGDGFVFHGGKGLVLDSDFSANTGNGITVGNGGGLLALQDVGSSTANLGALGLQISDGMQVTADAATTGNATPLTGVAQVKVGSNASQTWASVAAVFGAGNSVNDYTGAAATGARLGAA